VLLLVGAAGLAGTTRRRRPAVAGGEEPPADLTGDPFGDSLGVGAPAGYTFPTGSPSFPAGSPAGAIHTDPAYTDAAHTDAAHTTGSSYQTEDLSDAVHLDDEPANAPAGEPTDEPTGTDQLDKAP
jgi:hypothetical protein